MKKGSKKLAALFIAACFVGATTIVPLQGVAEGCVGAKAECVMELNSRRVLYEFRGDAPLPMASTTKIVTAATVLDSGCDLHKELEIPEQAVGVEGSSVYLKTGDVYTVEDLLYGLMLRSGNDCAVALALHCKGDMRKFATDMNETAQKAGALASNFVNPHGLPSRNHYTTARDLSLITCYAMQSPVFCTIVSTRYYAPRAWKNKNKMLSLYTGAVGVKTGYTKEAGRCLVSAATREGMTLVCTVLGCPTTYERSIKLLDDAFSLYSLEKLVGAEEVFKLYDGKVQAKTARDFYYPLIKEEKGLLKIQIKETLKSVKKEKSGEIVGQIKIYLAKQLLFSENLYKL